MDAQAEAVTSKQRQGWDDASDTYMAISWNCKWAAPFYAEMINAIKEKFGDAAPFTMLDVASAGGEPSLTIACAFPAATITSTDLAPNMAVVGTKEALARGLDGRVTFKTVDAQNLSEFPDATFDVVTCSFGIMFMPAHTRALAEFRRVLKPHGLLLMTVWLPMERFPNGLVMVEFGTRMNMAGNPITDACRFGDPAGLLADISAAGFGSVRHVERSTTFHFPPELINFPIYGTPLRTGLKAKQAAGEHDVCERASELLLELFRQKGYLQADGSVKIENNAAWVISAEAVA